MNAHDLSAPSSPPLSWPTCALIGLILGLGALAARVMPLSESLWIDELHTAWVVAAPWQEIPQRAARGNQSPLYFYGVRLVTELAGATPFMLRLASLVAGVAAVALLTAVACRWTRRAELALGVGLVAVVDVDWIFYATEARVYAIIQGVALMQLVLSVHLIEYGNRQDHPAQGKPLAWPLWVVLAVLQFYLHYSTALFTGCLWLVLLGFLPAAPLRRRALLAGIVVLVGCLPATWHLLAIFARRENWSHFISATSPREWTRWGTVGLLLAPPALGVVISLWRSPRGYLKQHLRLRCLPIALVALGVVGLAWTSTALGFFSLFFGRYLISAETASLLLLAALLAAIPAPWLCRGAIVLSVLAAFALRMPGDWQHLRSENWHTVVAAAGEYIEQAGSPPAVAIHSGLIETDILRRGFDPAWNAYACLPVGSVYRLPAEIGEPVGLCFTSPGKLAPWQIERLAEREQIVLLVRGYRQSADRIAAEMQQSLGGENWQVEIPSPQGGLVHWRILRQVPRPSP